MSFLCTSLIRWKGGSAARKLEAAAEAPGEAQYRKLLEITARNRDTEYGRKYGFGGVKGFGEWRKQVPVVTYEDIRPLVERVIRGEKNILTAEDPVMFAQTSGTTGEPKYVPITPTCQKEYAAPLRAWLYYALRDHPAMGRGKVVSLVSPAVEGWTSSGLPYGSTSGHMYRNVPWVIRQVYAIPYELFETGNYENKYYGLMRIGINADVTYFTTANPSSIIKICEVANAHADRLLKDIADGTLTLPQEPDLPPKVRKLVLARCPRDPDKARKLEKARSRRGGKLLPADYWPNLALIGCWKGGTVGAYLDKFPAWFDPDGEGGVKVRDLGYLSSEARGSIPLSDDGSGGVLALENNLYEFVQVADLESDPHNPEAWSFLGVSDLVQGKEYYVFLTTTGGLYRYDINDVIRVVGRYRQTPMIEFCRKGRGMTSITGEKVHVNQVIRAFEDASRELGISLDHFKAEADVGRSCYIFKMESSGEFSGGQLRSFLLALDRHLAASNLEYHAKRKSGRLNPPELCVMRSGWYTYHLNKDVYTRKRDFQHKTLKLTPGDPEPEYVKSVIHFEEAKN
jgi:hypothetical protein